MKRILHVVESFGGGVATAVQQYAEGTPEYEHHLLYAVREGDFIEEKKLEDIFSTTSVLPRSALHGLRAVRKVLKSVDPDVVHAHSSWAGVFVRSCCVRRRHRSIAYTPHAFAFTRKDISRLAKVFYRFVEWALSANTTVFAACSPLESQLARRFTSAKKVVLVPNQSDDVAYLDLESAAQATQIVAGGRISVMKDPDYFIQVVNTVRDQLPHVSALWVGGGEEDKIHRLMQAGVEVTGWLKRKQALEALSSGEVYVHTSRWEGMPLAIVESHQLGLPTVVREIDAFATVSETLRGRSPQEVAEKVLRCLSDPTARTTNLEMWSSYLALNTREGQATALRDVYSR